ncbi:MAG TPA: hypothetical protein VF598_04355 [Hymenobacter sp.]
MNQQELKMPALAEALLRTGLLLLFSIGFLFWFWPQYALYWHPVHTQATILALSPRSVDYKFYVPSHDKTLFFRREIQLHESQKLQGHTQLEVVYPASNPDVVAIPSLQWPLPVWFYIGVHALCLGAFIQSLTVLYRLANKKQKQEYF